MTHVTITGNISPSKFFKSTLGARISVYRAMLCWFETLDLIIFQDCKYTAIAVTKAGDHLSLMFTVSRRLGEIHLRDALKLGEDACGFLYYWRTQISVHPISSTAHWWKFKLKISEFGFNEMVTFPAPG